jgi:pyruvate/2-oxoglutarate dehydrogenase complex dihydrolipoamide acyltransferase (E2) component
VDRRIQNDGRTDRTVRADIVDVRMPKLGRHRLGTVHRVAVSAGDVVGPGDLLAEVEIAKAIIDITCPVFGRVARVLRADEGDDVAAGAGIAHIKRGGEAQPRLSCLRVRRSSR